ncbi:hypothetical protein LOF14_15105 [Klebsiella variicola subsp. variicola]|nr:hypothetical protein LOF14_15105 [Klebsiella variicola subsp. variicola]
MAAKASVEQGLEAALESALAHWLYHDEVWLRGNAKAKAEILLALARVRHTLVLFGGIVPRKATTQAPRVAERRRSRSAGRGHRRRGVIPHRGRRRQTGPD